MLIAIELPLLSLGKIHTSDPGKRLVGLFSRGADRLRLNVYCCRRTGPLLRDESQLLSLSLHDGLAVLSQLEDLSPSRNRLLHETLD